jgi:tRNA(Ile)-lysidine synthase
MKRKSLSATKKTLNFYLTKLKDPKLHKLYKLFSNNLTSLDVGNKKIMVGVSGGVDSLSVLFFSQCYAIKHKAKLYPVIIDHKLRKESTNEAKYLKHKLKKNFKIDCKILSKKITKIDKNIQSYARDLRYDLFLKECNKHNINYLLLGHHKDDLIENFFIRFVRGSGLKGLVSFDKNVINFNGIKIVRPFLSTSKKELINVNKKTFKFSLDDPTNNNDKFLRGRIRKLLKNLDKEGLSFDKFYLTLKNLSKSDQVIEFFVKKNINENSKYFRRDKKIILNQYFFKNPNEIILRSFMQIIQSISNKKNYPRGKKVISLINSLKLSNNKVKLTLSGCIVEKIADSVIIYPENR